MPGPRKAPGRHLDRAARFQAEDVGADKDVAVPAGGFSAGARNLARSKQVGLRSLEELEPHVVYDWLTDQTMDHRTRHVDVTGASFHLSEPPTEIDPATLASILEKSVRCEYRKKASIRYMTKPLMPWGKRSVGYSALALLRSSCRTGSTMIGDHQAGASQRADQPCFQARLGSDLAVHEGKPRREEHDLT